MLHIAEGGFHNYMLWLGIAAAGVFVLLVVFPQLTLLWQAIAFVGLGIALIPAYRHFLGSNDHVSDQPLLNKKAAQLVGMRLPLESAIVAGRGRVKIGDAFWQVRGPDMSGDYTPPTKSPGLFQACGTPRQSRAAVPL